jgi:hypothetical protein
MSVRDRIDIICYGNCDDNDIFAENKVRTRWDAIQSMADAKCALKHLFELASGMKREVSSKESKYEELAVSYK